MSRHLEATFQGNPKAVVKHAACDKNRPKGTGPICSTVFMVAQHNTRIASRHSSLVPVSPTCGRIGPQQPAPPSRGLNIY